MFRKTPESVDAAVRHQYYRWLTRQQKPRISWVDDDTVEVIGISSWYFATQFVEHELKVFVIEWETRVDKDRGYIHQMLVERV